MCCQQWQPTQQGGGGGRGAGSGSRGGGGQGAGSGSRGEGAGGPGQALGGRGPGGRVRLSGGRGPGGRVRLSGGGLNKYKGRLHSRMERLQWQLPRPPLSAASRGRAIGLADREGGREGGLFVALLITLSWSAAL